MRRVSRSGSIFAFQQSSLARAAIGLAGRRVATERERTQQKHMQKKKKKNKKKKMKKMKKMKKNKKRKKKKKI